MVDLVIAAANVNLASGLESGDQVAGEAFIAGAVVYLNTVDNRWYKAKSNGTAPQAGQDGIGMALGTADAAGARVSVARPGAIVNAGAGVAGTVYVPSKLTPGSLMPTADIVATTKVTVAALGLSGNQLMLLYGYHPNAVA